MPASVMTINAGAEEGVEQKEQDQRMAELGDSIQKQQQEAADQRLQQAIDSDNDQSEPDLLFAGKYRSAGDLEKAYLELQRKLGERSNDEDESKTEEGDQEGSEEPAPEVLQEDQQGDEDGEGVQQSELDEAITSAMEEFDENLSLSPETIEQLSKVDSKELIEAWAKSVQAQRQAVESQVLSQQAANEIFKSIGGEARYQEMVAWAADNLSPAEIASYDEVVNSGNASAIQWAVNGLRARYEAEYGSEGVTVTGGKPPANNDIFRSHDELARAMGDPRYESDPAYRMDVMEKLGRSGDLI